MESREAVDEATIRLTGQGLDTLTEDEVACCYALQDKVWVTDPDGAKWEVYTVLADAPGSAFPASWICQSTGTLETAWAVMDARVAVKKAPRLASMATASAIPAA